MALIIRYPQFVETQFYINYKQIDVKEYKDRGIDFYENILVEMKASVGCAYIPDEDEINVYIRNNENINNTDKDKFHLFIKLMFEKIFNIVKELSKIKTKEDKKVGDTTKREEKERLRMEKERLKEEKIAYNRETITCNCGLNHIRSGTTVHLISKTHQDRLAGIEWYKSINGL
jgi:Regulator of G protein signalling-like domain